MKNSLSLVIKNATTLYVNYSPIKLGEMQIKTNKISFWANTWKIYNQYTEKYNIMKRCLQYIIRENQIIKQYLEF